jgi:hypothetical protein
LVNFNRAAFTGCPFSAMKKGNTSYFLVLMAIVGGIYFISRSSGKEIKKASFKRLYGPTLEKDRELKAEALKNAYRLFPYNDSLLILTSTGNFMTDQHLNSIRPVKDLPQGGAIYFAGQAGDTLVSFNVDNRELMLQVSDKIVKRKIEGLPGNAIYNNGKFYFDQGDGQISHSKAFIVSWDPATGRSDTVDCINKLVAGQIAGYRDCLSRTLEGNFFNIDTDKLGYYFYYGGFFVVYDRGRLVLNSTIDATPFQKYEIKTMELPGNRKAATCYAANNSSCLYSAAGNADNIYLLSGVIPLAKDKVLYTPIDVYDAKNYSYRYTLRAPMKNIASFAYLIAVVGDFLYVYTKDNKLTRYKIGT